MPQSPWVGLFSSELLNVSFDCELFCSWDFFLPTFSPAWETAEKYQMYHHATFDYQVRSEFVIHNLMLSNIVFVFQSLYFPCTVVVFSRSDVNYHFKVSQLKRALIRLALPLDSQSLRGTSTGLCVSVQQRLCMCICL